MENFSEKIVKNKEWTIFNIVKWNPSKHQVFKIWLASSTWHWKCYSELTASDNSLQRFFPRRHRSISVPNVNCSLQADWQAFSTISCFNTEAWRQGNAPVSSSTAASCFQSLTDATSLPEISSLAQDEGEISCETVQFCTFWALQIRSRNCIYCCLFTHPNVTPLFTQTFFLNAGSCKTTTWVIFRLLGAAAV